MNSETEKYPWLKSTRKYGFDNNRYPQQFLPESRKKLDLELRTFAGDMGKITERAAVKIINQDVCPDKKSDKNIRQHFEVIHSYISEKVAEIPNHRELHPTFRHDDLYRCYIDAMWEPGVGQSIRSLAVAIDERHKTDFFRFYNELTSPDVLVEGEGENRYRTYHSRSRYLIDAMLAVSRFAEDAETLEKLRKFGRVFPNLNLGTTQLDGIFIPKDIEIPPINKHEELLNFLHEMSFTPPSLAEEETRLLTGCSLLELKLSLRARDVAQRPPQTKPRKMHIDQTRQSLLKASGEQNLVIAPGHLVIVSLGGLQPNIVHVERANSTFWSLRLGEATYKFEQIMENDPELHNTPKRLVEDLLRFIGAAGYMAHTLEMSETFGSNGHQSGDVYLSDQLEGFREVQIVNRDAPSEKVKRRKPKKNKDNSIKALPLNI